MSDNILNNINTLLSKLETFDIDEKKESFYNLVNEKIESLKNIYLKDSRIKVIKVDKPLYPDKYLYVHIRYTPENEQSSEYVIYHDLSNRFKIDRNSDRNNIDSFYRNSASTENLSDWVVTISYGEKRTKNVNNKNIIDILDILYKLDSLAIEKTKEKRENKDKYRFGDIPDTRGSNLYQTETSRDGSMIVKSRDKNLTPYERTRAEVYRKGNKWQIENWEALYEKE